MSARNGAKTHKDNRKAGPSGVSRNNVFSMLEKYGLTDKLLRLNEDQLRIVAEIKTAMGGDDLIAFVTRDFSTRADAIFATLGVEKLTMENAWAVFECMLPLFVFDLE